ncbi:MAG: oxidoreductase [Deltaproteobacteria bacterium]|nr:MAG: oxidoreductase [Deltaproteobacteria bacterium]
MKVYFFATCLGGSVFSKTSVSAVKLLQREGVEVVFKKKQTCCGQPSYNTGYFEETKKVALYNMDLFSEDYPIVVPSGSCTGMMKHDYIELFKGTEHEERAKKFSARVYELGEFLDKVLNVKYEDKGAPTQVTWHSNCHALRVAKSIASSKNLIRRFANVELIELEREEECCGFGGTFSVKETEISNAMANQKIKDIEHTGVKYVIAGDSGCIINIDGTMKRLKKDIKVVHLYDFLYKRLEGEAL